jgi:hypothetical protein
MLARLKELSHGIDTIEDLREHLQIAIELEHSTIPPYLCALYSIEEGANPEAAKAIRGVVMEEMLHMTLAANVLIAVGGRPRIDKPDFVPQYPTRLPHSDGAFQVNLEKFSRCSIETFLKIEKPAGKHAPPQSDHYTTIGQFYGAIKEGLKHVCGKTRKVFTGNPKHQITGEYYYGGGGKVFAVTDLKSALAALELIVEQGEGTPKSISDGDCKVCGQSDEPAHYFRFNEIYLGRHYTKKDTPNSGPTGSALHVDWDAVHNMLPNPRPTDYPTGTPLRVKAEAFDRAYTALLKLLHRAFNGRPQLLIEAVPVMYSLKYKAVELMKIPSGCGDQTAGPSFQYTIP